MGGLALNRGQAAPMGNASISVAEVLDQDVLFTDLSIVDPFTGGPTETSFNNQYGIGQNMDVGFDVPLMGGGKATFNATRMLYRNETTRWRLAVGGLGEPDEENLELVVSQDHGPWTLTLGAVTSFPHRHGFGGASYVFQEQATLHLEYIAGPEAEGALGVEWTLPHDLGLILSLLTDFDGHAAGYLNLIAVRSF